jgi:hypothetical protein
MFQGFRNNWILDENWMLTEYDNSKDASNQPGIIDLGWILWRNENSLLIKYYDN